MYEEDLVCPTTGDRDILAVIVGVPAYAAKATPAAPMARVEAFESPRGHHYLRCILTSTVDPKCSQSVVPRLAPVAESPQPTC